MKRRYGRAHRLKRAAVAADVRAGRALCARCHEPIRPYENWDLDHDDDDPTHRRYLGPSHARCNRQTVTHLKERLAAAPVAGRRSEDW